MVKISVGTFIDVDDTKYYPVTKTRKHTDPVLVKKGVVAK